MPLMLGFALTLGCTTHPLEPEIPDEVEDATSAKEVDDAIVNRVAGVTVEASVDEWEGDREVFDHVTPVRLSIVNDSGTKLRINYEDIELQGANGTTFQALPLYRIDGTVSKPILVSEWEYSPTYQEGFYVAPYTAPLYQGDFLIYEGHYDFEPGYYSTYYQYWADVPMPTQYMVQNSLPEGVMPEQGKVAGWVYFEKVPTREDLEPLFLTVALVNADDGERIGRVRLPFSTD